MKSFLTCLEACVLRVAANSVGHGSHCA